MTTRTSPQLPRAIERTLRQLNISGYKAALQAGWDPSFMSKVLKGYYPMGLKRLTRLADRLELSAEQRAVLAAAYAHDQGYKVEPEKHCGCRTCLALREYAPGLVNGGR